MSRQPIRIAVVGAGSFGRNHVRVLSAMPEVHLAAIVDTDFERAQTLAAQYGSRAFASIDDVAVSLDAAVVATPTLTHRAIAEGCCCWVSIS